MKVDRIVRRYFVEISLGDFAALQFRDDAHFSAASGGDDPLAGLVFQNKRANLRQKFGLVFGPGQRRISLSEARRAFGEEVVGVVVKVVVAFDQPRKNRPAAEVNFLGLVARELHYLIVGA